MDLTVLPCLDSEEMAAARRRELGISRAEAAALGRDAVEAAERGWYEHAAGRVDWSDAVAAAVAAKTSIPPGATLECPPTAGAGPARVQVTNETTLGAARRLVDGGHAPLALNFANGAQPGGGFLGGARAQEEALCRSSALYPTLVGDPMYAAHRERGRPDSTDWAILSPRVPVFRADAGPTLPDPWPLDFLTCAAPYAPAIGQPEAGDLLERRIRRVLDIARSLGYRSLVLGAWGCGAFANDPTRTPADFRNALQTCADGSFSDVIFAVTDWSPERRFLAPFRDAFRPGSGPGSRVGV